MLTMAQCIDALMSRYVGFEDDWDNLNMYEKLLDGTKRNFSTLIGRKVSVPLIGEVTLVHVQLTEPVMPESDWGYYDTPFYQGYQGEGFIVIEVNGVTYKKPCEQDSYGRIRFRSVEDCHDEETWGLKQAEPKKTMVEVWA